MKLIAILYLFAFTPVLALCQTNFTSFYNEYLLTKNRDRNFFSRVGGSPYENPDFISSTIYMKGNTSGSRREIRYNNLFDEMELSENETGKILILGNKEAIDSIHIEGKTYICQKYLSQDKFKGGYFVLLADGKCRLLMRKTREFIPEKVPTVGYESYQPATINPRPDEYYFQEGNEIPELMPSGINNVRKFFLGKGYNVTQLFRESNIRYNKESLFKVVRFINNL